MTAVYLWANAVIYGVFAIMCMLRPIVTSRGVGFLNLSPGGMAEFITVYGGLELGLGIFFAWTAYRAERHRSGLMLALALYLPIVVFRWINVARQWPVAQVTLGTGMLETVLLLLAIALWITRPRQLA